MNQLTLPIYFVTGCQIDSPLDEIKATAAESIVADFTNPTWLKRTARQTLESGPGGKPGLMFSVVPEGFLASRAFTYQPDHQQWEQIGIGLYGCLPDGASLLPEHMLRLDPLTIETDRVIMADGSIWDVPVLRDPTFQHETLGTIWHPINHKTSLPSTHFQRPNEDGSAMEWVTRVADEYQELYDQSRYWFTHLSEQFLVSQNPNVGYLDCYEYAVAVLGLKYRYTLPLHNLLQGKLLNSEQVLEVMAVSCGWQIASRIMQKKNRQPVA